MSEVSSNSSGGIGFCGFLTLVFITLRLLDVIQWSWWWVLSPLWIPLAVLAVILAVVGIVFVIAVITK